MSKKDSSKERTSYKSRSDDPPNIDRSQLFWSGVNAVRNVQKSSQCDSYHFIASTESRRRHRDETERQSTTPVRWMIYPEDKRKIYWDCISSAAVIYAVAEIPFSIGFLGDEVMPIIIVALDDILVIVFWIEIVLSFNCAYVDAKTRLIVTDRKQIAIRYCKFWFWFDLVSAAPLRQIATYYNTAEFSSNNYSFQLVRLFRLSRLVFVYKLFKSERLSTHLDSINVFPQVKNSCLLFLQIFLTAHVLACFWFFITTRKCTGIQNPEDAILVTWATNFGFQNADIFSQYIASLYFTFETLFTIGYGDFYATNMGERVYVIVVMLIGSLLFGAIIAQIKDVLDSLNIQKTEAIKKLEEFSEFMEEKRYPLELRVRAKEAYSYYLDRRPSLSEKGLFDMLPRALKIKVLNLKYRREIMSIDFFQSTDIAFAVKLLCHSRPYSLKYGQCIYGIGDVADELSFLIRGSVRITAPSIVSTKGKKDENRTEKMPGGSSTFGYATSGGYFGDFEYSKSGLRNAQYTAGQSCICISVSYLVVSEAIKDCPVAGAIFLAQIKERSALYSSQKARKLTIPTPVKGLALSPVSSKADLHSPHSDTIQSSESRPRSFTRVRNRSDSFRKSSSSITEVVWVDGALKSADASELTMIGAEENTRFYIAREEILKDGRRREVVVLVESEDLRNTGILMPTGRLKTTWDFFIAFLVFYSAVTVPLHLVFDSFSYGDRGKGILNFDTVVVVSFFLDMVATINTAYYCGKTDAYIVMRNRILEHYMRTWFVVDLFSCLPFDSIVEATVTEDNDNYTALKLVKIIKFLRLIRLVKLSDIRRRAKAYVDSLQINNALVGLVSTILVTFIATHFLACIWWGVASHISTDPWFETSPHLFADLVNADFSLQYVTTIYLSLATLTSTGFGDIVPGNTPERCMAIFLFLIGTLTYAYITTSVSNIVRTYNRSIARNDNFTLQIKEYLDSDEISKKLLWEVIGHAKKVLRKTSVFNEGLILERLPSHLRIELLLHEFKEVLESLSPLKFIENNSVKLEILRTMRPNYADKGRCIIKEGETTGGVVFLITGSAIITKSRSTRKAYTGDTSSPHTARRRGAVADLTSENVSRKSGVIELTRRISSSSYRSKYFSPRSNDVIAPRGTLMKLFHSHSPLKTSSNSLFSSRRNRGSDSRFPSTDDRGSEHGAVTLSNKSNDGKGAWKGNEMDSSKSHIDSDSVADERQYRKSSMDAESVATEEGRRFSNDSGDGRHSRTSPNISPSVSRLSSRQFNQYNDGTTSDKSDQKQQQGYNQGYNQDTWQGPGLGLGLETIQQHSPLTQSLPQTPLPSHSTTQIPLPTHSTTQIPYGDLPPEETVGLNRSPISLRTLPARPPITMRNSSSNIDRDKRLFAVKQSKSVADFFHKPKHVEPVKIFGVKSGSSSSLKARGPKLPSRSSFFAGVSRYVSSSTDHESKHEKHSRRNRSGSMDGMDEKSEDVLGVLNGRDFIGYVEMQYSSKHTISVTAVEPCWYYTFDHANVLNLLESNPRVAFEFQRALGLAIEEMDSKLLTHEKHQKRSDFLFQIRKKFQHIKMGRTRRGDVFAAFATKHSRRKRHNLDISRRSANDEIPSESWHSGSNHGNSNKYQALFSKHSGNEMSRSAHGKPSSLNLDKKESKSLNHSHHGGTSEHDKSQLTNIPRSRKTYHDGSWITPKESTGELLNIGNTGTRPRAATTSGKSTEDGYDEKMVRKLAELDRLEAMCNSEELEKECHGNSSNNMSMHNMNKNMNGSGIASSRGPLKGSNNDLKAQIGLQVETRAGSGSGTGTGEGRDAGGGAGTGVGAGRNSIRNEYQRKYTLGLNQYDEMMVPQRRSFRNRLRSLRSSFRSLRGMQNDYAEGTRHIPIGDLEAPPASPAPPASLRERLVSRLSFQGRSGSDPMLRHTHSNHDVSPNTRMLSFSRHGIAEMERSTSPTQFKVDASAKYHRSSTDIYSTKGRTRKLDQNFEIGNKRIRRSLSDL